MEFLVVSVLNGVVHGLLLFMVSAGVVVDVGAMGSHAMIVSRELGIPCAAGVPNATSRIPTGTLLEVDGSSGKVTVLEG